MILVDEVDEKLIYAIESATIEDEAARKKYLPASEMWLNELRATQSHVGLHKTIRELTQIEENLLNSQSSSILISPCLAHRLSKVLSSNEVSDRLAQAKSVFNPLSTGSKETVQKLALLAKEKGKKKHFL